MNASRYYLLIFSFFCCLSGYTQSVTVGPYLQKPTSTSTMILWQTDSATMTQVRWGVNPSSLTGVIDFSLTTNHKFEIGGLAPFTKYFYAIGDESGLFEGPDSAHYFITSPVPGTIQPVRIWAIGDFGRGNDKQKKVRDAFVAFNDTTHLDVWLWLGDNVYDSGTTAHYIGNVFDTTYGYGKIFKHFPFMPTPGNHDYLSVCPIPCDVYPLNHSGPYYDFIEVPKNGEAGGVATGHELFYSFDYANIHFISLNSELGAFTDSSDWTGADYLYGGWTGTSPLTQWLETDLLANNKKWTIAYWHQTPYAKGSHNSDNSWEYFMRAMREHFLPIIENAGVDLVLAGHDHVYERSFLIQGHYDFSNTFDPSTMIVDSGSGTNYLDSPYYKYTYGPAMNKGTVYVVCGNSGSSTGVADQNGLNHPAMYFSHGCDTCSGSVVIDVNGNRLDAKYLTAWGAVLDSFTIIKKDTLSFVEPVSARKITVFPNPAKTGSKLKIRNILSGNYQLRIVDLIGTLVFEKEITSANSLILLPDLEPGIYVIKVSMGDGGYFYSLKLAVI